MIDEVQAKRESVIVTKLGKAVAKREAGTDPIFGFYKGKIKIVGDIMEPFFRADGYEQHSGAKLEGLK